MISPKKLIIYFSGTACVTFSPPASKFFIAFSVFTLKKSSIHHILSVYCARHLLPFCLLIGCFTYFVVPNVELPPLCSPNFKPGPPSEQAQVASQFMDDVLQTCVKF